VFFENAQMARLQLLKPLRQSRPFLFGPGI
jgi:hypothetical protein